MNLEKIKLILHKLGILRAGSYTWKGHAKDRPIESIMDDVYDAKKDLIHKEDFKVETASSTQKYTENTTPQKPEAISSTGRKALHIIALVLGIFFIFVFVASGYFGLWLWIVTAFWLLFTRFTKKFRHGANYARWKLITVLITGAFTSFISLSVLAPTASEVQYSTNMSPLTMVDLGLDLETKFALETVRVSEATGNILEVRLPVPEAISPEAITSASAYIMRYLEAQVPESIQKIRIIFTVNDLDAVVLETPRAAITQWKDRTLTDTDFIQQIRKINLAN